MFIDSTTLKRVNINGVSATNPYKGLSRLDTPEIRAEVGVIEIAEPAPPQEAQDNPDWYIRTEQEDAPYLAWTRREQSAIDDMEAAKVAKAESIAANAENAENATIKYLTTHDAAQIATYVNNNVTDLASAKVVIARLAIAIGAILR